MYNLIDIPRRITRKIELWSNSRKPRIFFMHLGKCGGSSVANNLRRALNVGYEGFIHSQLTIDAIKSQDQELSFEHFLARLNLHRIGLVYELMSQEVPLISGHVPFHSSYHQKFPHYDLITVVRDPLERIKSSLIYRYTSNRPLVDKKVRNENFEVELEHFLNSDRAQFESNHLSESFGGYNGNWDEAIDRANTNLRFFRFIGDTDKMSTFYSKVNDYYKIKIRDIKYNITADDKNDISSVKEIINKPIFNNALKDISKYDLKLYDIIRSGDNYISK